MSDLPAPDERARLAAALAAHVRVVRPGTSANCSSIGSVVDMLFAGGVVGGALFAAACAALTADPAERREAPDRDDEAPGEREDDR
ncbi:MAG: hypothetical protein JNL38_19890 [Myxococcales bacterium]|nr:hypothetical protein [Myxococcales bacterium]